MKVICINAGVIVRNYKSYEITSRGGKLVEGKIYTAISEWIDEYNSSVYFIEECVDSNDDGQRLKSRFRIIDTDWIDEAIEKALNEEPELVNA